MKTLLSWLARPFARRKRYIVSRQDSIALVNRGDGYALGRQRGFTVVETVVVLSIVALVSTLTFSLVGLDQGSRYEGQVQNMFAELRQMKSNAQTVADNKEYGMSFGSDSWTTFSNDPATGTQTTLQTRALPNTAISTSITPSDTKVIFERLTGKTKNSTTAAITLTHTKPNRTQIIRIQPGGVMYVE